MNVGQKVSRLHLPQRAVWLSLLLILGIMVSSVSQIVYADYADGTGQGLYQNQIYWLEWDGFTFADGQSRTFNLPGNVTVVATVSNVSSNPSNGAISVGRPEDYGPAAMNLAYPNTGYTAIKSCNACTNLFRLTLSANVAGTAVPVDVVVADAEAAAINEYLKVTTDGNPWQLLEQFQAANLRATWSNGDKTLELHGNGSTPYGTVLAVSTGVTNFDFEIAGGGVSAAALGVFLPSDYGDAPASFNDAGHYIRQSFTGGLPGATKVYDPVSTAFTSFATISDAPTVYLGPVKPDADPGTQNAAPNATNAQGDDLNNTDDEDGVASFPPLTRASTSYSVSATAYNTSGGSATLWGWVDFDGNGQFSASEVASAAVANGANPASVTLSWPAVTVTPAAGSTVYARLRLTTGTLTDIGATPQDERAQGGAADGEVEDYAITIPTDPIKDSFIGCGVITFDSDAQGFRTASTREDRTVNQGPFDAPYGPVDGTKYFRWESTGGNPSGHLRADDLDGEYQEVWTPAFTDPDFSALIGQQIQFDYKNDTGYNQYRLYIAIVGTNGNQYYYYFNNQLGAVGSWSRVKVPMVASAWHTGFEAGENPSTPPDSPAPSAIDFAAVLGNLGRFAVSVEGVSGVDTSRFDNFGRACDYGDLPESGTSFVTTGANAARHNISDEVRLGALIDSEPDGQPGPEANGDDLNNTDDEDGVASFPVLTRITTSYAVAVSARNTSGAPATLWGWVDFNGDGQFSATEVASAPVANGANPANVTLNWSSVNVTAAAGTSVYARFRITTNTLNDNGGTPQDERAQGRASDGEVEDYAVRVRELGTITIAKVTIPGNNTSFDFTDNIVAPNAFSLRNGQQKTFLNVPTGTYAVTEEPNTGSFQLRLLSCVDDDANGVPSTGDVGTRTATIHLDPNETVTCTFTNSNQPLGMTLASFDAAAQAGHVLVTWETVSEVFNTGFNLYRTVTADPPTTANLLAMVPSQGPGSTQGFFYTYQDTAVTAGRTYWYWLEDVDLGGVATMHGPVSVVFAGPTAVTISGLEAGPGQPAFSALPWLLLLTAAALAVGSRASR